MKTGFTLIAFFLFAVGIVVAVEGVFTIAPTSIFLGATSMAAGFIILRELQHR